MSRIPSTAVYRLSDAKREPTDCSGTLVPETRAKRVETIGAGALALATCVFSFYLLWAAFVEAGLISGAMDVRNFASSAAMTGH